MPLTSGSRLGPYEIIGALGAGGMGEVYRARDTRLDRIVAIKVLPAQLAADPQFRERFDREAHAIAALNHPHICSLHDVGHENGTDYLVFEYLEGESLATRLLKGALPIDQVLRCATEIADALDKAHRAGIVHRDLKPGNVMLTKSGAKLLDFGLARTGAGGAGRAGGPGGLTALPTEAPLTGAGTILGTLQYMAPEQLEGKEADARTDIFALGAVVYEMATGRRAFEGKSQASLIAAILEHDPPPITLTQPLTPPALDHVVRTCLAKDPDERWQSAADITRQLRWIGEARPALPEHVPRFRMRALVLWAATIAIAGAAGAGIASIVARANISPAVRVIRSSIVLPPGQTMKRNGFPTIAISPDGSRVAYVATDVSGRTQLYVRAFDQPEAAPVTGVGGVGTDSPINPFFSPDGQWLTFVAAGKLKKVAVTGGAPVAICDLNAEMRGATWTDNNTIVFAPSPHGGLWRISASGGAPTLIVKPDAAAREKSIRWPSALPDGHSVLATVVRADAASFDDARIEVVSLDTGERRVVLEGGTDARYLRTGHLVYSRAGSLLAVAFDPKTSHVSGTPATVAEHVFTEPFVGYANFSVADDGSLLYASGGALDPQRQLVIIDRDGRWEPLTKIRRAFEAVRLSPDARRLAVSIEGATDQTWVYDIARDAFTRLTFVWDNNNPIWTPDGKQLTFGSNRDGRWGLFVEPADGTGDAVRLTTTDLYPFAGSWSPDGRILAYARLDAVTGLDLWTMSTRQGDVARPFVRTPFNESYPRFSPDGRWLAYMSDESGRNEIYVRHFPDGGARQQLSTGGGDEAVWSRDGHTVFYRNGEQMMAADVGTQASSAVRPKALFKGTYLSLGAANSFDVLPDGRFVMIVPAEAEAVHELAFVQNWFADVRRRVPR